MDNNESGISMEELIAFANESQEMGKRHKVPGEKHLMHLLASIAREAEARFGADGIEMVEQAVARFGEERGRCVAQKVKDAGRPLTVTNFFLYSDLDTGFGIEKTPELVDGEFHTRVSRCGLNDRLAELGLEKYAKHYCIPVDIAILKGYNPKLKLEIKSQLTREADCCHFVYSQPPGSF